MRADPAAPTSADRALLLARSAWGRSSDESFQARLARGGRERLASLSLTVESPETALAALRQQHTEHRRADLARVHSSWWLRALQDESPAVQRAVALHGPPAVAEAVRDGLGLTGDSLRTDRPPHPEALAWALTLWTERLVGGPASGPDDLPIVSALAELDGPSRYRLVAALGLVKLAYALDPDVVDAELGAEEVQDQELERLAAFRTAIGRAEPRLVEQARQDVAWARAHDGGDGVLQTLGLISVARLLSVVDPHRARWALQHVSYKVAKFVRARMSAKPGPASIEALADWEDQVFEAAWNRLRAEGRLPQDWRTPG